MSLAEKLREKHKQIIAKKPIVLNITNYVTQDFMANILLALGCAPIMSESQAELSDLIKISDSININIGTLNREFNKRAITAAKLANKYAKCLVLDPVGAGASKERNTLAGVLMPYANIIRGNASEIIALAGNINATSLGVESTHQSMDSVDSAKSLACQYLNTIVVSGKTDLIITKSKMFTNNFGNALMTKVTGMGCALSAVIAAFATIGSDDYNLTSYLAVIYYTLCAEQALKIATTPAKFKLEFIDCIYHPDWSFIEDQLGRIE